MYNGSFYPLEEVAPNIWNSKITSYRINNSVKDLQISKRLHGLQIILHVELMALYTIIKLNIEEYYDELVYIFIDNLNFLYFITTRIKHSPLYANHLDKTIYSEMVTMIQQINYTL